MFGWHALRLCEGRGECPLLPRPSQSLRACHPKKPNCVEALVSFGGDYRARLQGQELDPQ